MVRPERMKSVFDRCTEIIADRNKIYGDKIPDKNYSMNFATLKLQRVDMAKTKEAKIDDLLDAINYAAFVVIALDEEK